MESTLKVGEDGTLQYFMPGTDILHREDGPAFVSAHVSMWYREGKCHRIDGPAKLTSDGTERWYIHGLLHREDGPAVIGPGAYKAWFKNGLCYREESAEK